MQLTTKLAATVILAMGVLLALAPQGSAQGTGCDQRPPQVGTRYFVTGVDEHDADGGLIMRADPGVASRRVGVLHRVYSQVEVTGRCWTSATGSPWYEIWTERVDRPVWASANFLTPATPACLPQSYMTNRPFNAAVVEGSGWAIRQGASTLFARITSPTDGYDVLPSHRVEVGSYCAARPWSRPASFDPAPPIFNPRYSFDLPTSHWHGGLVVCG